MCPAGLTGSYEKLDIEKSVDSIVNYVKGTLIELKNIARSLGRKSIHDIRKEDSSDNGSLVQYSFRFAIRRWSNL